MTRQTVDDRQRIPAKMPRDIFVRLSIAKRKRNSQNSIVKGQFTETAKYHFDTGEE